MRRCVIVTVCMLLLPVSIARAEFYRWVDKEGKEFFTNNREQVPQEYRDEVLTVNPDENRVSVGKTSVSTGVSTPSLYDHKDKNGKGEAYWRNRAAKLRKELAALQDKYDLLIKREREDDNKPKKLTAKNSSKAMRSRTSQKKKETLEKDISRKKHELEVELPDEARKADAYPVWIRD
jgi:hypothetical protein